MLGRVRTCSLSSLEVLEIERTPSKLLKDDSLSIYEKTLLKLQQGSQQNVSVIREECMNTSCSMETISSNEASVVVNASADSFPSSGDTQNRGNLSVLCMFSRYKSSKNNNISSTDDSVMAIADDYSSANVSPNHDPELQQGCIVNPPSPF